MDSQKKVKIIMIIILILIVIMISIVVSLLLIINKEQNDPIDEQGNYKDAESQYIAKNELELVNNRNKYYAVKNIVDNYILYIKYLDYVNEDIPIIDKTESEVKSEYREYSVKAIMEMLDKQYVKEQNMTYQKIYEQYKDICNDKFTLKEIYIIDKSASVDIYIVNLYNEDKKQEFKLVIKTDSLNSRFSIFSGEYAENEKYNEINLEDIPQTEYNTFRYKSISDETMAYNYLRDYINNVLNNTERAYNSLDEEYRKVRFGSLKNYNEYIEQNKERLEKAIISKYQISKKDNYTQYIIVDKEENYYIFKETAVMNYTVILDQYTIDLPEYIEKYNKSKEQEKVALCINRFIQAINAKDYKYAYSKLADSFKQNYFTTQESFEKYVKENFFEKNKISLKNFGNQATIYTYETVIANEDKSRVKAQSFVVNLKEGTDFEMSFQVE